MVASSWALIFGTAGTPPSLAVKVARLGEPPSRPPLSAAAGNLPPAPATINHRQARDPPWPQRDRPRRRPLHLPRALRSRVTECEHDDRPNRTQTASQSQKPPTQPENASTECDALRRHPGIVVETVEAALGEPAPPATHPRGVATQLRRDLRARPSFCRRQHDPAAKRERLRALRPASPPLKRLPLLVVEHDFRTHRHDASNRRR